MNSSKPVHTLILDSGPIIKNEPGVSSLIGQSEALITVPSVIAEIRDVTTRSRIEVSLLPFLQLREPKPESMRTIVDFARKTGDLEVLSKTDLQVLALAYELECERNGGDWRLRRVPGQKRMNGPPPEKKEEDGNGNTREDDTGLEEKLDAASLEEEEEEEGKELDGGSSKHPVQSVDEPGVTETLDERPVPIDGSALPSPAEENGDPSVSSNPADSQDASSPPSESSDSEGWITPSNIKKHKLQAQRSLTKASQPAPLKVLQVATLTTDFAMQNVLMQMNLNLLSPSLQRVRHVKTFILRCHACFAQSKDTKRQFCARCGKPTLTRVSCSTLDSGEFKIHLKKNMRWNARGDRYSIPKPVGGSANGRVNVGGGGKGGGKGGWGQSLILSEDQKEYTRAVTAQERVRTRDLMDQDYLPGILTGERGRVGGRVKVGAGRNVNSRKRM
ncbi:MAG: Nin1 binding protein [Peltula sp. TS41687]|nr:MAG: Nin1 binding protein [Peltula sp. TS41687]